GAARGGAWCAAGPPPAPHRCPAGVPGGRAAPAPGLGDGRVRGRGDRLALGIIVLLVETHVISVPAVHEGAGTVSGRTPLAAVVWLVSWAILRYRWRERDGGWRKAEAATVAMIVFGLLATFPLVWRLF